jgi:hypothetical protein
VPSSEISLGARLRRRVAPGFSIRRLWRSWLLVPVLDLLLRRALELILLCCRSREFKELEIIVLRHELEILRRQQRRPGLRLADRVLLAAASRLLPRNC